MKTYIWVDIIAMALGIPIRVALTGRPRDPLSRQQVAISSLIYLGFIIWGLWLVTQ